MLTARPAPDPSSSWLSVRTTDPWYVYGLLLDALVVEALAGERTKPPCCDELGEPPPDAQFAEALAAGP